MEELHTPDTINSACPNCGVELAPSLHVSTLRKLGANAMSGHDAKQELREIRPVSISTQDFLEAAKRRADADERERLERFGTAATSSR